MLVVAAIAAGLAGCTGSSSSGTKTVTVQVPVSSAAGTTSTAAATSAAASTGSTATSSAGAATSAGVGACVAGQVTATLGAGSGSGAGHAFPALVFTNNGTSTCTVRGYPGVSFVGNSNGTQLGAAATREAAGIPITTLTLAPGASAHAQLSIAMAGNYDAATCKPKVADGLRVYPPDDTNSLFVATTAYTACQNASVVLLVVRPLQAGAA
jgi:Protein of unknown function (DUF4232)